MRLVIFDSSFLIALMESPTTWYEDLLEKIGSFQPLILDRVVEELERIEKRGGKRAKYASLARDLSASFKRAGSSSRAKETDDVIIAVALEKRASVATLDARMMERLRALRIQTITLRGGRVELG